MINSNKNPSILFVDDAQVSHNALELIISEYTKYNLISAYNSAEALDYFKANKSNVAAVIVDITLPDLNGFELISEIGKISPLDKLNIIFHSGYDHEAFTAMKSEYPDLVEYNFTYLSKPYKYDQLVSAIKQG